MLSASLELVVISPRPDAVLKLIGRLR